MENSRSPVALEPSQLEVVLRMMEQNLNSPKTSSCGRLFDAVAALVGIRSRVNYEAQAAIELEMAIANDGDETAYAIDLMLQNGDRVIDTRRMFEQILTDLDRGLPVSTISRRFHNALIASIHRPRGVNPHRIVAHSGVPEWWHVSQRYLLSGLQKRLSESGFEVFIQSQVPAGDGGLSLGQAMIAAHQLK